MKYIKTFENKLVHDDDSEIKTVIKRMQEGLFEIKELKNDTFYFSINLVFNTVVPVPSRRKFNTEYLIINNNNKFTFQQINGDKKRIIKMLDGYIIWSLLMEKYENTI